MQTLKSYNFWFVTGSQHLYGNDTLMQAQEHARIIVQNFNDDDKIPFHVVVKPIVTSPGLIRQVLSEANADDFCAGVITWMHTFSPAKMWISGLAEFNKPLLHLHTQFNRDIPWNSIDMNFMNLNQSAHGDREYGFIGTRLKTPRKVVAGYWQSAEVKERIRDWMRVAVTVMESRNLRVARFGDNMRQVAVTDGDKVEAQIKFGWSVDGYGVGDLVERIDCVTDSKLNALLDEYASLYEIASEVRHTAAIWEAVREQARIELGIRSFLEEGNYHAFTTTFEDLHGLRQLPGLAVQHLMADGYGFGGEGDWKSAALVRLVKVMAGFEGTSFMEDYTYHFEPGNELVLGAHMLEVCPTIAAARPRIEVHPLSIGGKEDPARLLFDGRSGSAVCVSMIDLGNRFRLVVNEVDAVQQDSSMPNLPVARVLWRPRPSLSQAAEAWIYSGGAHHTAFSYNVSAEQLYDLADILSIEYVLINHETRIASLRNELRYGDIYYRLR